MSDDLADSALTRTDGSGTVVGIRLDRLASLTAGILATAFGSGVAGIVDSLWSVYIIRPLNGIAGFIELSSLTFTSSFRAINYVAWTPLTTFVESLGPAAWIGAVLAVLLIAYGVQEGWSLRG